jgi:glucose-1-phosphatase
MIRGIIFDCFGVLYHGSIGHLYELTPKESRTELANLSLSSDYGYISRQDFIEQVAELTGKTTKEIERIMQSDHIRNQALVDYIRSLRPAYKIALLSNIGRGVMNRLFTQAELEELFDVVVLSSDVGMIKPDPDIFKFTADKLGVLPEECLMVDDVDDNIEGANSTDMQGVVFTTTGEFLSEIGAILAR